MAGSGPVPYIYLIKYESIFNTSVIYVLYVLYAICIVFQHLGFYDKNDTEIGEASSSAEPPVTMNGLRRKEVDSGDGQHQNGSSRHRGAP